MDAARYFGCDTGNTTDLAVSYQPGKNKSFPETGAFILSPEQEKRSLQLLGILLYKQVNCPTIDYAYG
jgi:hypothetical protein